MNKIQKVSKHILSIWQMFIDLYFNWPSDLRKIPLLGFHFECSANTKFFGSITLF